MSCISVKTTRRCRNMGRTFPRCQPARSRLVREIVPNPRPGWDKGPAVAKALVGYVRGPDPRILSDLRRLRRRIRELEAELARIQQEHDVLSAETGRQAESGGR